MTRKLALASLLLASVAACDAQVDADHQGTALVTLTGSVRNTRTQATPDAEVAVVWVNSSGSPDLSGTDSVEVEGSFPAQFTLSIYQPPEPALLNDWDGVKFGVAYILAGLPGTDYANDDGPGILGIDADHLLVYVPADVPADSPLATVLRGAPRAGFHVYGVYKLTAAEKEQRGQCVDALPADYTLDEEYDVCGGDPSFDDFVPLATDRDTELEVELIDDIDDVDVPEWT
jgi:hypothetical protein